MRIERPELPGEIERLLVHGLLVTGRPVDLNFQRVGDRVTASLARSIPDSLRVTVRV